MAAVSVFPSPRELGAALARLVVEAAAEAVASSGRFTLGLSGGSMVELLARELPAALRAEPGADPSRWLVAFCDERLVPPEHPDSTYGAYRVLSVSTGLDPDAAASDYWEQIKRAFPGADAPQFDLLLLGVGPDGHTCSLFPGHPLLQELRPLVLSIQDSPKPPSCRVTMTLPLLNLAQSLLILASGASKAAVVQRILEGSEQEEDEEEALPAARVQPSSGKLRWLLDQEAAKNLRIPLEKHPQK